MENRDAKEILGRYVRLKWKNSGSIKAYLCRGSSEGREAETIKKIERQLRKEREAGLLVQAVLDWIPNETDRQILELRYMLGRRTGEIARELYGRRQDFEEHAEAYQVKVLQKLGLALLAAAKVLRELGLDEASAGEEDPDEDPE